MKRLKKSLLTVTLIAALLSVMLVPKAAIRSDAADATTQSLQDQINSLSAQISEYEKQIADLSDKKASEMEVKANLDALGSVTQQKISKAEALSEQLTTQIDKAVGFDGLTIGTYSGRSLCCCNYFHSFSPLN